MRKTQERVVDFIIDHSNAKRSEIVRLMNSNDNMSNDVGTILFGSEAVKAGIIDNVGGLSQAIRELRSRIK
jgi:ATP-dependent protease ClpP protease subunit